MKIQRKVRSRPRVRAGLRSGAWGVGALGRLVVEGGLRVGMGVCGERLRPAAVRAVTGGITRHAWVAWSAQVKGSPSEEILEIAVKPGWKKGTKITFQEKGARPAGRGRGGAQGGLGCRGGMPRPLTAAA